MYVCAYAAAYYIPQQGRYVYICSLYVYIGREPHIRAFDTRAASVPASRMFAYAYVYAHVFITLVFCLH